MKVSDIDSKRMLIRVEQGKGRKDRQPCSRRSCSKCCAPGGGSAGRRLVVPGARSVPAITTRQLEPRLPYGG